MAAEAVRVTDPEDDYRESEDEDYNPANVAGSSSDESDAEADAEDAKFKDEKDEGVSSADFAKLQGSGGLIKTRAQRRAEEEAAAAANKITVVGQASVDVDALWAEMNSTPASASQTPPVSTTKQSVTGSAVAKIGTPQELDLPKTATTTKAAGTNAGSRLDAVITGRELSGEEYIDIERTFKFAGKVTTEKKRVLRSSAEGQQYLKEQREAQLKPESKIKSEDKLPPRRGPVKRKMSLMEEYQAGKTKKITTLEKSRLDWLGFVDSEGIQSDLKKHNKSGYLDKQGFLARVEHHVDQDLRSHRQK